MKQLNQGFKNAMTYAAGMENWVNNSLPGGKLKYTFVSDFARIDWLMGKQGVLDTYKLIKKSWLDNYKAWTEVVIAVNMLAWAHDNLRKQGYAGREPFIELYSDLYYEAKDAFYEKYTGDEEKCHYFFQMTD